MAKIIVAGDAVVITSAMKLEDLRTIAKYRPEALVLKEKEDMEPIFAIGVAEGHGHINKYGAVFGAETRDEDKLATITVVANVPRDADIKEFITDELGFALINLNKLEETLPDVLTKIKEEKKSIMDSITVAN